MLCLSGFELYSRHWGAPDTCICLTHWVDNSRRRATAVPNLVDRI